MTDFELICHFNKMMDDMLDGWSITTGEVERYGILMKSAGDDAKKIMRKIAQASFKIKGKDVYKHGNAGTTIVADWYAVAKLFSENAAALIQEWAF